VSRARSRAVRAPRADVSAEPSRAVEGGSLGRHIATVMLATVFGALFWYSRLEWDPEMRLWRAFGDAAFVLLFISLSSGPLARLWPPAAKLVPWRRELGIWFAALATAHTVLVLNGWVRWDALRFLGYEFIPEAGRWVRLESGFGLSNIMGVVALAWSLALAATSSDAATRFLGPSAWKWLHTSAYVIFYLTVLHAAYFLFLHYTVSFHRPVPPPDWFRWPFVALGATVVVLQLAAFASTVARRRRA
jgi:sulfoxide reductase heme-binding subunit YedZ